MNGSRYITGSVAGLVFLALAPAAHAAPRLGLYDDLSFTDYRPDVQRTAFVRARAAGARVARITLDWSAVVPKGSTRPSGFDATDPASKAYNWSYVDDAVRAAARRRLRVMLTVVRAPDWAGGARRPNPAELASFVRAAARRYSGFFPDPKHLGQGDGLVTPGRALPRVRYWQIWDAPNSPRRLQPATATHYRSLLNAAARTLRAVGDDNLVVTAGTTGRSLGFWRRLLCVTRSGRRARCPDRARFDVAAHNAVTGGGPARRLAVLTRLRRLVRRAVRLHTVSPARRKPLWITAVGWDTPPLAPRGVRPPVQARFLSEAVYRAQRTGASVFIWQGLQDRTTYLPGMFPSIKSGLYATDAKGRALRKPSLAAFRFPFLVRPARGGSLAWGIAPHGRARVAIQKRSGRRWRTIARRRPGRAGGFQFRLRQGRGLYRAKQRRTVSASWRR